MGIFFIVSKRRPAIFSPEGFRRAWALLGVYALLASLAFCAGAAATPLLLSTGDETAAASGHLSVLRDDSGTMTLDDVMARRDAFTPIPGTFNAGHSLNAAWWLRLSVETGDDSGGMWLMQMSAPYTDYIDVYVPTAAQDGSPRMARKKTGSLIPLSEREFFSHVFVVRIDLENRDRKDIYIRMAGSRSLSAAPVLWRVSPFLSQLTFNLFLVAYIVGAASLTALGAVIFGVWLRSPPFIWYGAYLGCAALVILGNTGFATLLLHPLSPAIVLRMQGIWGCCAIMTAAFVVRAIFCAEGEHPVLGRVVTATGLLSGLYVIASAFGYYGSISPYLHINLLILCVMLPWLAAMRVRRGEPAAWWYFFGFTTYALSGVWFTLMVLGVLPASGIGVSGYQIASIFNMVAILVGLATSVRAGARERRDLQAEVLRASQRKERELEEAVAQRTLALEGEVEARRSAEGALRVALREQRHFLTMVSHEFRTPLAAIQVAIAIVEPKVAGLEEMVRREARKIARTAARMSHLINAFLTEEVLDKRVMQLRCVPTDISALVVEVVQDCGFQGERDIQVSPASDDPTDTLLDVDDTLLRAAVENLLTNAVKYSEGAIHMGVSASSGGLSITVADCGPAIPEADLPFVFERYYRGESVGSQTGLGIGLSIVQRVASAHGGEVRVESKAGVGNTFTIWLPYAAGGELYPSGAN
ncbi:sensor histidine kinase [Aquabacter cavernae]|uniref:sensor histidine kinase n=1 Tax=Aquabacter cavernae TaxID=2496029 RepID=UPI000F8DE308|nr:sensor histidine kinase [Aquabacter cavernae]